MKLNPCARVGHIEREFKSHNEQLEIDFDRYSRKGNVTIGLGFSRLRNYDFLTDVWSTLLDWLASEKPSIR